MPKDIPDISGLMTQFNKKKRTLTPADKKRIAAKQRWKCNKCRKALPARYHVDHIKQFSKGGDDRASNLQALCPDCHANKTEDERYRNKQKKSKSRDYWSWSI